MSLGTPEILVILLVALLVFGPHRLPDVARQVGGAMREMRRIQDTVKGELDMVLHPEHGTRSHDSPNEPGDHTGDGFVDEHFVQGDLGDGYSDFTPPDALNPAELNPAELNPADLNPAELDASHEADVERRFLGPPDSFI
jgi:Tat protein translocase TatB subunit